jgi:hypothetical protein
MPIVISGESVSVDHQQDEQHHDRCPDLAHVQISLAELGDVLGGGCGSGHVGGQRRSRDCLLDNAGGSFVRQPAFG